MSESKTKEAPDYETKNATSSNNYIKSIDKTDDNMLKFTISDLNHSYANGLRRTILSDISVLGFKGFPHSENDIEITDNTTILNNEIIKHRITCIPVYFNADLWENYDNFIVELDVKNNEKETMLVTTKDFKIKDITTDKYLPTEFVNTIFHPNEITGDHILIVKLLPKMSNSLPGQSIKLSAKFSMNKSGDDAVYNVVSCCTYRNTPDKIRAGDIWTEKEVELKKDENNTPEVIKTIKSDWINHHSKRIFIDNSFDFTIQTVGVFSNKDIVTKACEIINGKLQKIMNDFSNQNYAEKMILKNNNSTIQNSYDIILEDTDYTIGAILEYVLHNNYYKEGKVLSFVGFNKSHPHDSYGQIRLGFNEPLNIDTEISNIVDIINSVCNENINIYNTLLDNINVY